MRTKRDLEKVEAKVLAEYATKSVSSLGRKYVEIGPFTEYGRLEFQKDRDRVLHSRAFRRLDEKTQVFPAFFGDHYRTRLTHTLEVAQISRDIARRLGLNEDLAEAIALAHDLGHPPFGHAGEDALDEIMKEYGMRFEHNEQSKRVVEKLEKIYPDFEGLNLTHETLEGLEKHKTSWDRRGIAVARMHLEGQVVNIADEIAYTNHDMDDGIRSGLITVKDLEKTYLWKTAKKAIVAKYGKISNEKILVSRIISQIINIMIFDICNSFNEVVVVFSPKMSAHIRELRDILFKKFYLSNEVKDRLDKGKKMIKRLFKHYMKYPAGVPAEFRKGVALEVAVKDYIAGMTDQFLEKEVKKIKMSP